MSETARLAGIAAAKETQEDDGAGIMGGRLGGEASLEQHVKELFGLPDEWQAFRWEVKPYGIELEGAVPNGVYQKGKYKGAVNWKLVPKEQRMVFTITDAMHDTWLAGWEARTGRCYVCKGTAKEWHGWSREDGNRYRPCTRCNATGTAQPQKPIGRT